MNVQLKKSYAEVGEILNVLGDSYKEKLPKPLLELFEVSAQETSDIFINEYSDFSNIEISREALIIISILNLKYWEQNTQNINSLKKQYQQNETSYKNSIVNSNELKEHNVSNNEIIVTTKQPFFEKVKLFFSKFLKR